MLRTLTWKETRELLPLVVLAIVAQGLMFFTPSRVLIFEPFWAQEQSIIPFVDRSNVDWMLWLSGFAALTLGFWQTLWESGRGTFLFLLHRPISRASVFGVKLTVGIVATLAAAGLPALTYALWAATPGTHASPFYWSMTTWAWLLWFRLPIIYLGAFLSGLREGNWFGSRALPLLVALLATVAIAALESFPMLSLLATLLIEAWFVVVIYRVAATRDYS